MPSQSGMHSDHAVDKWAEQEFGQAELGNRQWTARAVAMARAIAAHPSGLLTQVFAKPDEREAAFRFVRNEDISPLALMDAAHTRTAQRCAEHPFVFIAVDQADLSIIDHQRTKGLGDTGTADSYRVDYRGERWSEPLTSFGSEAAPVLIASEPSSAAHKEQVHTHEAYA